MNKRILPLGLAALLTLSLVPRVHAADRRPYTLTYDVANRAAVYTIGPSAGQTVTIDCGDLAASLILAGKEPGQAGEMQLKFVNESGRTYIYDHTEFTTVNRIDRQVSDRDPELPPEGTLRLRCPVDTGSVGGTRGFDETRIPYSMNVLRSINAPLMDLYGGHMHAYEVTVSQVMGADQAARKKGFDSYSDYLLNYYRRSCPKCREANSLYDLEPEHLAELFGTRVGGLDGQSEIRQPRFLSRTQLASPAYQRLRQFGWASQEKNDGPGGLAGYSQAFELLETDPELIRLGYWFLYEYGILFTFDSQNFPIREAGNSETQRCGLEMAQFLRMEGEAEECTKAAFDGLILHSRESKTLPHVSYIPQVPNSYDDRGIDFGFSVTFVWDGKGPDPGPGPTPDFGPGPSHKPDPDPNPNPAPDPNPETNVNPGPEADPPASGGPESVTTGHGKGPQTGDDNLMLYALLGMILCGAGAVIVLLRRRKERGKEHSVHE